MISGVKNGVVGLTEFRFFFWGGGRNGGQKSGSSSGVGVVLGLGLG